MVGGLNIIENIKETSKKLFPEVKAIRRHLHKYPELSFQEKMTSSFIKNQLKKYEISFTDGWVEHGIVAIIGNPENGPTIALRGDMDALPITEENKAPYVSLHKGVMHACGHDVHTSCLMGAAIIVQTYAEDLKGAIKFIFQPGEEKLPGGAKLMIDEGVLENPEVKNITGQHVHPPLEVGKVGVRPGPYMASADEIFITIEGKGGHGALPHLCVDPIIIASQVILSLQNIVARNGNSHIPSVLTIGKINSDGGATNIIPDRVFLEGTFRTMDEKWRMEAHSLIERIVTSQATAMGGKALVNIKKGYPALKNDEFFTMRQRERMVKYLGEENVVDLPKRMTAEDFSYYSQKTPACFYRLGTGNKKKGITSPVHTPTFDIDEDALLVGMGLMAYLAIDQLI